MKTKQLTVKRWINEVDEYLNDKIDAAVTNKQKLHITAPVGVGKTTLAIDLIKRYKDNYQVILLEPIISITGQVGIKLKALAIDGQIYNCNTKVWVEMHKRLGRIDGNVILSTIDSAYILFENGFLDHSKTICLIDESHYFIQNARKDFDHTIRAILDSGVPVIGFTATKSTYVLENLFGFDESIEILATDLPAKVINPVSVTGALANKVVAYRINDDGAPKSIIWTENKSDQREIKKYLEKLLPNHRIAILNTDTNEEEEKDVWDYLIQNDKIPDDIDIAIINSVASAGINILNTDIKAQYMVGKFDPFSFRQYLGRVRNYDGEIEYIFNDHGPREPKWKGIKNQIDYQNKLQHMISKFSPEERDELMLLNDEFSKMFSESEDGSVIINKCIVASHCYQSFRDLRPSVILDIVQAQDSTLRVNDIEYYEWDKIGHATKQKASFRGKKIAKLPNMIKKNYRQLVGMLEFFKSGMTHDDVKKLISESLPKRPDAKKNNVLYVPRTKKASLLYTIKTAEQAGVGMQKLILASTAYSDNGKDATAIEVVLKHSNSQITQLIGAKVFFSNFRTSSKLVKVMIKSLNDSIGKINSKDDWMDEVYYQYDYLPGLDQMASSIWRYVIITARRPREGGYALLSVATTFEEYLEAIGLDKYFKAS